MSEPFGSSTFCVYCPACRRFVLLWRHHRDTNHLRPACNKNAKWIEAFCPKSTGLQFWSCIHIHCLHARFPEAGHSGDRNDLVEELPIAQGRTYVIVFRLFIRPLHTRDQFRLVVIFRLVMELLMDYKTIVTGSQSTTRCDVSQFVYFCKMLYMFQTGFRYIIRSWKLHIIQSQVFVRPIPDAVCAVLSSWWWTKKPPETCRASYRNKYIEKRCILLVVVLCEYISDAPNYERYIYHNKLFSRLLLSPAEKCCNTLQQNTVAIIQIIKFIIHEYFSCDLDEAKKNNSGFSRKIRHK